MKQQPSYAEQVKGKTGLRRIINALGYSADGIKAACTEQGFRQLLWLHGALLAAVWFPPFSSAEKMVLVFASFFSIIVELLNTGLEAAVDHTSLERHPLAKRAKDVGSAAQYASLLMTAVLWGIALWPLL
ncbi:MAG: diacylglycerol kinase [Neisseria sp.]|nr:diacylglycerol kinase [Neisseria sp.]